MSSEPFVIQQAKSMLGELYSCIDIDLFQFRADADDLQIAVKAKVIELVGLLNDHDWSNL